MASSIRTYTLSSPWARWEEFDSVNQYTEPRTFLTTLYQLAKLEEAGDIFEGLMRKVSGESLKAIIRKGQAISWEIMRNAGATGHGRSAQVPIIVPESKPGVSKSAQAPITETSKDGKTDKDGKNEKAAPSSPSQSGSASSSSSLVTSNAPSCTTPPSSSPSSSSSSSSGAVAVNEALKINRVFIEILHNWKGKETETDSVASAMREMGKGVDDMKGLAPKSIKTYIDRVTMANEIHKWLSTLWGLVRGSFGAQCGDEKIKDFMQGCISLLGSRM